MYVHINLDPYIYIYIYIHIRSRERGRERERESRVVVESYRKLVPDGLWRLRGEGWRFLWSRLVVEC